MDRAAVFVSLTESGADAVRLDTLTRQMQGEFRRLDILDARAVVDDTPPPAGARGVELAAVGQLMVTLLGTQGLAAVINAVRGWLDRGHEAPRSVRVELDGDVLELSGASPEEQDRLVAMFLSRHSEEG
jgi:Effector Associated Constant Component 1